MKNNQTKQNNVLINIALIIPFVLIFALMIALFTFGLILIFYAFASIVAFNSAMICLILIGAGLLSIGCGIMLILAYQKYFSFFKKKIGNLSEPKKQEKTVAHDKKSLKDYFSLSNIALCVLAIGAVFTLISAGLGSIKRENWQNETAPFLKEYGYYESTQFRPLKHSLLKDNNMDAVNKLEINLQNKEAVIVYTSDLSQVGYIDIDYYEKFQNQVGVSRSKNGKISITENSLQGYEESTIKKIFFFMFDDSRQTRQIIITLPSSQKDNIEIVASEDTTVIFAKN